MKQPPVLFCAFANETDRYLDYLKRESTVIHKALLPLDAKGFIKLIREESTTMDDLFQTFQAYKDRIAVFHFAGHADGQQLNLEDQSTGMQQLAQLIAEQKENLKLVFLNGCATAEQVEQLHRLGIPVVIATQCAIEDNKAHDFANRFYSALANHYSLEAAFMHAKTYVSLKHQEDLEIYRGAVLRKEKTEAFPWGLYVADNAAPDILQWKLPQYYAAPPPASIQVSYAINKNILRLLKAIKAKAPHLDQANYPTEEAMIITSFPWVISVHLFRLFADAESMSVAGLPRLRELLQAYVSTTRFLSYIALSQLWNELKLGKINLKSELNEFFLLHQINSESFDYMLFLQKICNSLKEENIEWFIPEVNEIATRWGHGGETFDGYTYMEAIKQRLLDEVIPEEEVETSCYLCESVLTDLLSQAAVLANFSLLTVRNIRIINPGHIAVPMPFEHMIGDLHVPFQAYLKHRPRSLEAYINSHSVLLTERSSDIRINKYLNLSPLYIDKTAFGDGKGKNTPMIYTLQHWDKSDFVFQNVNFNVNQAGRQSQQNNIDFLNIGNEMDDYQIILEQMNSLIKDLGVLDSVA